MRLNQIPTPGGPPGVLGRKKDVASTPAQKQAAARAIGDHIWPDTGTSGSWADDETAAAVKEFDARDGHGWLASGALKKAHKTWGEQVKSLMDELSSQEGALLRADTHLVNTDVAVHSQVSSSSLFHY
jgi:hypothetical protein